MGRAHRFRRAACTACVAALVVTATLVALNGRSNARAASSSTQGVTKDSIKVGIAIIDYSSIKDFLDYNHGDQRAVAQSYVDDINAHGGINGRKIVPVFKEYPPIPGSKPDPLSLCTSWAEDDKVFAVLGVFIDFTGQGILCLTREHHVIHIGHELDQPWIDESPGGTLLTPDNTKEGAAAVLVGLLADNGRLKGKTVAVMASKNGEPRATGIVVPALKQHKVKLGSTAILTLTGPETEAVRAQLDAFIEKWKTQKVDTVFLSGLDVTSKSYVSQIKQAMPDVQLVTDADSTLEQARDEVAAGTRPNPYAGLISTTGLTFSERWAHKSPLLQKCVDVYEKASGKTVPGPENEVVDADGKKVQTDVAVMDFCGELSMFRTIAEKVGPDLTVKNWQKAVDGFGPIDLVSTPFASLCKGKYAANDAFRLVSFDPSAGSSGDWKRLTPVKDANRGACAKAGAAGS